MSTKPNKTVQRYRSKLDRLQVKYTDEMTQSELKDLLDKVASGASEEVHNEVANEEAAAVAEKETEAFVDKKIAALEAQIAEMKEMMKAGASSGSPTLTPDLVREIGRLGREEVVDGLVDPTFIKPEDELEKPITFYRYGPTYNIFNIWKAGVAVKLPYDLKLIKFEKSAGWTSRSGRGVQNRIVSVFVTKNKKVADVLKQHHEFGKTIHIDRQKAFDTTITGRYMDLYNQHYQSLQGQPIHTLAEMAKGLGVEGGMSWSHEEYCSQIAEAQALTAMKTEKDAFESNMRSLSVEKELLQQPSQ